MGVILPYVFRWMTDAAAHDSTRRGLPLQRQHVIGGIAHESNLDRICKMGGQPTGLLVVYDSASVGVLFLVQALGCSQME